MFIMSVKSDCLEPCLSQVDGVWPLTLAQFKVVRLQWLLKERKLAFGLRNEFCFCFCLKKDLAGWSCTEATLEVLVSAKRMISKMLLPSKHCNVHKVLAPNYRYHPNTGWLSSKHHNVRKVLAPNYHYHPNTGWLSSKHRNVCKVLAFLPNWIASHKYPLQLHWTCDQGEPLLQNQPEKKEHQVNQRPRFM